MIFFYCKLSIEIQEDLGVSKGDFFFFHRILSLQNLRNAEILLAHIEFLLVSLYTCICTF